MKHPILTMLLLGFSAGLLADPVPDPIAKICAEYIPWNLPKVVKPYSVSETYLSLNGKPDTTIRVCQCTDGPSGEALSLWVRAQSDAEATADDFKIAADGSKVIYTSAGKAGNNVVSLLRGRSCIDATGSNIAIHHSDAALGRTGAYKRIGE